MVIRIETNVFEVVVLAAYTETFLCVGYSLIPGGGIAQEVVFELDHPAISKEQGGVVLEYQGCRWDYLMPLRSKEIKEFSSNANGVHRFWWELGTAFGGSKLCQLRILIIFIGPKPQI
jgi:hypothetical protein